MRPLFVLSALILIGGALSDPARAQSEIRPDLPADHTLPADGNYLLLHTGEIVDGDVAVFPSSGIPTYAVANGQRYEMDAVRSYVIAGSEYTLMRGGDYALMTGSLRPVLLKKREAGRISVYEEAAGGRGFAYIQVADGPVLVQTSASLRSAFAEAPDAMYHLDRERAYGRYGFGAMAAGALLVTTGTAIELGGLKGPNGFLLGSSGVLLAATVNAVLPVFQERARRSAIAAYNR